MEMSWCHGRPSWVAALAVAALATSCGTGQAAAPPRVEVAAGVDHGPWDGLLKKYVDEQGLVAYGRWRSNEGDRAALRGYLDRLAASAEPARGADRQAALINAYNALTVAWILENYPTRSIRSTRRPFQERRHRIGGRPVSLDDIEHGALRPEVGYRVHAVLVCAARSCPPLSRDAYGAARLEEQLDSAMRRWLAREDLNRFEGRRARISRIFKWFGEDFERSGGLAAVLARHAPVEVPEGVEIEYLDYDWALNDRSPGA